MTKILKIDALKPEPELIRQAAVMLDEGKLVVFPTETVYGLGANAFDEKACAEIFRVKGRPGDNPLIITVSSLEMAQQIAEIPKEYLSRIKRIWPSPISFILKAKKEIPRSVIAGLETIVVRMPAHPVALALIKECGVPIAGPSANPSGKPTATNANQVIRYFDGKVDCIIDSGKAFFGVESTIIELDEFKILRPGPFTPEEIEKAFGKSPKISDVSKGIKSTEKVVTPGTKYAHYAPNTPLFLLSGTAKSLIEMIDNLEDTPEFVFIGSNESCEEISASLGYSTINLGSKSDYFEIAKNLYDGIILLDSMRVKFGVIEAFDEKGIGLAIMNRIRKACANISFSNEEEFASLIHKY